MACVTVLLLYKKCLGGSRTGLSHLSQLAHGRLARGQRLAAVAGAVPVAWAAGTALTASEGLFAVAGIKEPPCSSSCTPPLPPLAPPKETDPVLCQVEYLRCHGIVKVWLLHISHRRKEFSAC